MTKPVFFKPYQEEAADLEYNLLFCDYLALYRDQIDKFRDEYWRILLKPRPGLEAVRNLTSQPTLPARLRILAFNYLIRKGEPPSGQELLGVILEAGGEDGLETLAAYTDYRVVYIDSRGVIKQWEAAPMGFQKRLVNYFISAAALVEQLHPSDKPRFPPPFAGMARITMLVSNGLYFGQGPANQLTKDGMSGPIIRQANQVLANLIVSEK